jgi:hypothetical protein
MDKNNWEKVNLNKLYIFKKKLFFINNYLKQLNDRRK